MKIYKNINEWKLKKIDDLFFLIGGGTPSTIIPEYWGGNIHWISIKELTSKNSKSSEKMITKLGLKNSSSNLVKAGNIILGTRISVGETLIHEKDVTINQDLKGLYLKNSNYNAIFFKFLISNNKKKLNDLSNGLTVKGIKNKDLKNFVLKYPDFIQQNNIAKILSKQEEQIETIKRLIKNVEKRNQYYSEKLLSGELRLRKNEATGQVEFYENTEWKEEMVNGILTKIPSDWNAESLTQNNFIIKSGIRRFSGTKKYYATANIGQNFLNNDFEEVTFENRPSRANFEPVKNSIWFAKMKGTYKNLLFKEENDTLLISSGMAGIQINIDRFDLNFMFHFIRSAYFNKLKDNLSQGGIQISINNDNINKIHFIYPENIYEQKKISFILNFYNDELKHLESLQKKEEKRFQWMLDNLLSGEYEVIDED